METLTAPLRSALARPLAHPRPDTTTLVATDYAELDDRKLAALAARGREPAFRELLQRYERPVFSLVYRMVRDRTLAEDLAQEAFVRAFNAISSYKPSYKFSNWILKIANNHTIDYLRKRKLDTISIDGSARVVGRRGEPHPARHRLRGREPPRVRRKPGARRADRGSDRDATRGIPYGDPAPARRGIRLRRDRGHHGGASRHREDIHPPGKGRAERAPRPPRVMSPLQGTPSGLKLVRHVGRRDDRTNATGVRS